METKIKGRQNIHEKSHATTAETIISNDESLELSDSVGLPNETQDSEDSLAEQSSKADKFKRGNLSKLEKSVNNSRKNVMPESSFMTQESVVNQPQSIWSIPLFCSFIFLAVVISWFSMWPVHRDKKVCSFLELRSKYQKEGDYLWNPLKYGIEDILNNESDKPAVFLFVHHGKQITDKLIKDIAQTSSTCFGSSAYIKNIDFTSKNAIKDYGHVIAEYKESIKEGNVVLIANLNKIPGEAANALHSICDTVTPLVKKVIILLSLTVEKENMGGKVIDTTENALRQLWQDKIKPNELEPIITRVSDQVLLLQSN